MADSKTNEKTELSSKDFVPRGFKSSSPFNTALFLGLRTFDCVLQFAILANGFGAGLIKLLGGEVIPDGPALSSGVGAIDALELSAYRLTMLAMITVTAIKHWWFVLSVSQEAWTVTGALGVGFFNIFWNTTNNLLFLCAATSAASGPGGETLSNPRLLAGLTFFVLGIGGEWQCEIHRKAFKADPRNKGKAFTGGLFALVRHPNYSGYSLWRAACAMAGSGMIWSVVVGSFFLWDFASRAIPALDEYCTKRYASQWSAYKQRTPCKLVPFLW
ncbi:ERG4/ERG24 ergosterol biosynthesis-like protein [Phyllosticta citribraziliensis]|uniref:ERG4/ERG24 ergosterol biosynthesis-like protein n=1 Tax=Phyllosticta citribraziliensis TaxID=989973 RepID=A0ABR1L6F2_9PEZI